MKFILTFGVNSIFWIGAFIKILFKENKTDNQIDCPNFLSPSDNDEIDNFEDLNQFIEQRRAANSVPFPVPVELDDQKVSIIDDGPMRTLIWNDQDDADQRVIFYLHGGSYFKQPKGHYFNRLNEWAKHLNAKIIMPIYPKGPTYTFKGSADRLLKLYQSILESVHSSDQIYFIGDSAGAGLLMGLADYIASKQLEQPKEIILISPWLDIATDNPEIELYQKVDPSLKQWILQEYARIWADGEENYLNPLVSPIFSQQLFNLGKITLIIGTHELFYPDNELLHEKLIQLNIPHNFIVGEGLSHNFALEDDEKGKATREKINQIILENLDSMHDIIQ